MPASPGSWYRPDPAQIELSGRKQERPALCKNSPDLMCFSSATLTAMCMSPPSGEVADCNQCKLLFPRAKCLEPRFGQSKQVFWSVHSVLPWEEDPALHIEIYITAHFKETETH